jgi:hypothetical protein
MARRPDAVLAETGTGAAKPAHAARPSAAR